MLRRKPLWLIERQAKAQQHSVPRAYDLASLLAVGIGYVTLVRVRRLALNRCNRIGNGHLS